MNAAMLLKSSSISSVIAFRLCFGPLGDLAKVSFRRSRVNFHILMRLRRHTQQGAH